MQSPGVMPSSNILDNICFCKTNCWSNQFCDKGPPHLWQDYCQFLCSKSTLSSAQETSSRASSIDLFCFRRPVHRVIKSCITSTYACKFPMRAHARKAGPPKKSFKSSLLILKSYNKNILVKSDEKNDAGTNTMLTYLANVHCLDFR